MAPRPKVSPRQRFIGHETRKEKPHIEAMAESLCYWLYPDREYSGFARQDCIGHVKAMFHRLRGQGWKLVQEKPETKEDET